MNQTRWDRHFIRMARLCSEMSEDKHTHVGAVIVGPDNEIRSTGYNGFPRKVKSSPERFERPEKYHWFEHAERNAIYNAARIGVSTKDCTLYVQGPPCVECARSIIQSGITRVVIDKVANEKWMQRKDWTESIARSIIMFEEAEILIQYQGDEMNNKSDAPVSQSAEDTGSKPASCEFESHQVHEFFCMDCGNMVERCAAPPCLSCGSYNIKSVSDK